MYLLKVNTERRNTMYNPLLKTFVYVVEMGSFSKAAQKMYITPASVMKRINALEEHRGIKLTLQGQKVYDETKILIEKLDTFLNQIQEKTSSIIRIGSSFLNPAKEFIDLWHSIPPYHNVINYVLFLIKAIMIKSWKYFNH